MKIKFDQRFIKVVFHGPQEWPWWLLVSFKYVNIWDSPSPMKGFRIWFYTRWGSWHFDLFFDGRE